MKLVSRKSAVRSLSLQSIRFNRPAKCEVAASWFSPFDELIFPISWTRGVRGLEREMR